MKKNLYKHYKKINDTKHYNYGDGCSIKVSYGKASGKGFTPIGTLDNNFYGR